MTWKQLKNYIETQSKNNENFLNKTVRVYDYEDGEEHSADIMEFLDTKENDMETGWVPYLTINDEVNNGEIKETSIA